VQMLEACLSGISACRSSVRRGRLSSSCCDVGPWQSPISRCGRGVGSPRSCHLTEPRTGCGLTQRLGNRIRLRPIWS
jgi:hypothetical protein